MISNSKFKISNFQKGATVIELIVVISIIVLFTMILIANFPEIQRNLALSRAVYELAQDFRKVEDYTLSGVKAENILGQQINDAKGYGLYFDFSSAEPTQYIVYADIDNTKQYNSATSQIIEIVDVSEGNPALYIKEIMPFPTPGTNMSINFSPPNPTVTISNLVAGYSQVEIVLGIKDSTKTRRVLVNKAGAISAE